MIAEDIRERFNTSHGKPFDRGSADSWYSRPFNPITVEWAALVVHELNWRI